VITVDQHAAYPAACAVLQQARTLPETCLRRPCQSWNKVVEHEHRFVKRRANPGLGCGALTTAQRTIPGDEAMHRLRQGQLDGVAKGDILAPHRVINQLFG
jgi:transposase, IS6 family